MICFSIPGNHEDPKGNPIGYTRTTQGAKQVAAKARRYNGWKDYVWNCLRAQVQVLPRFEAGQKVVVSCYIEFRNGRRPDPGNVVKGIADALADRVYRNRFGGFCEQRLYPNDRCVLERVRDFSYSDEPGVMVTVYEMAEMGEPSAFEQAEG
jgi:hypothetical protein